MAEAKFFVGGVDRAVTTTDSLRAYFEVFGEVIDAVVMIKGGISRGFGFVTFADGNVLPADFASQVHIIDGKQVEVKAAVPAEVPEIETNLTKIFVGGLAPTTTTAQLEEYFSQFGVLVDAVAMVDNGKPRGFGFVQYATPEEAALCLSYGPAQTIDGKLVEVKLAEPKGSPYLAPPTRGLFRGRGVPRGYSGLYPSPYAPAPRAYGAPRLYSTPKIPASALTMNSAKIFVGGLAPETGEEALMAYFGQYGNIVECEIMRRAGGISRGFGFVVFSHPSEAEGAIVPQYHVIEGRPAEVKACLPKTIAPPPQRFAAPQRFVAPQRYAAPQYIPRSAPTFRRPAAARPYTPRVATLAPRYRPY